MLKKKSVFYIFFLFFLVLAQVTNGAPVPVEQQPPCNLPAPNNLHTTFVGSTTASVAWDPVAGAWGYAVYLYQNGGMYAPVAFTTATNYTWVGLNPETEYTVEVYSMCGPNPTQQSPAKSIVKFKTQIVIEIICEASSCPSPVPIGYGHMPLYHWKLENEESYALWVDPEQGITVKYKFVKTATGQYSIQPYPNNSELYKLATNNGHYCIQNSDPGGSDNSFQIVKVDNTGYTTVLSGVFGENGANFMSPLTEDKIRIYKISCTGNMANPNAPDSNDHFSEEGTELALTPLPNPFSDRITIKGSAGTAEEPVRIALFNSEGVLVKQEEAVIEGDHTLATDDLPPGLYFLQLKTAQSSSAHKLIKL